MASIISLFLVIGIPLVLILALGGAVAVAQVVFEPLERRVDPLLRAQFGISDLLCLLFVLQATLAPWWIGFRERATVAAMAISIGLIWALFTFGWMGGVLMLSRARVAAVARRALFLGLVVPITYIAAATTFFGLILAAIFLVMAGYDPTGYAQLLVITLLSLIVVVIVAVGLRASTAWIADASPHGISPRPTLPDLPLFPWMPRWLPPPSRRKRIIGSRGTKPLR